VHYGTDVIHPVDTERPGSAKLRCLRHESHRLWAMQGVAFSCLAGHDESTIKCVEALLGVAIRGFPE
jgi:hypothetical protein